MACSIEQKTLLEQAADFVECPNSMVPEYKRDAMILAALLNLSTLLTTANATLAEIDTNTTPAP